MKYRNEFLMLAKQLIKEFDSPQYFYIHYFSEFVQKRLLEIQEEEDSDE